MKPLNLDQCAAQYAQKIITGGLDKGSAKEVENLITKTLGVLQEQGVYASMLFLFSRTGKEEKIAPTLRIQLYTLLKEFPAFTQQQNKIPNQNTKPEQVLEFYSNDVCNDLYTLLLVKDVYEQTLIYARYGAKAASKQEASA